MPDHENRTRTVRQADEAHATTSHEHLAPHHVMVGDLGVFAGDWAAYDHHGRTRYPTGFVGRLDAQRGRDGQYAVFSCDRAVAEAIVAEQGRLRDETRQRLTAGGLRGPDLDAEVDLTYAPLRFDGDEIVMDERLVHGEADRISRICPDADGRYAICAWQWEWRTVAPTDCDHVVGAAPTAADQPARIPLVHSPLHVPHDRLTVTNLHQRLAYNGVAFTATLCLDGTPVGMIEYDGNGGETWLRHHDPARFSWRDMHEFVLGCRYLRQPTDEGKVLDRLVTEYDLARQIAPMPPNATLARSVNDDGDFCGDTVALESLHGLDRLNQPVAWTDLARYLATFKRSSLSTHWQVWRNGFWRDVPALAATADVGANRH
ncbi:hypothetical protein [Micromonospora craniellae]|uniref:Uncharacterized protein n=1 Tax=Micromonospora craniellae TaxID=2294034 RepID=A0A372FU93_9ACTN|nr:hypothetical protein [Micromonospora craniellae]QOC89709.1 hypothetical protein ID554_15650 [Micromonospora craniellae]RFS44184.1 hypothetical protein D0Q02_23800 [Micromonospora craniellae]